MVKYLKCPDCSYVFKAPLTDMKRIGIGFSPPGLGVVECPNCKQAKPRKFYIVALEEEYRPQELIRKF
jgi:uncharacterized C2H2 Zn-finger protein